MGKLQIEDCSDSLQKIIKSTQGGIGFLKKSKTITTEVSKVVIDIPLYNKNIDLLMVHVNGSYIEYINDYTISTDSGYIESLTGKTWKGTGAIPLIFDFVVFKAILLDNVRIDGKLIYDGTIPFSAMDSRFMSLFINELEKNYTIDGKVIKAGSINYSSMSNTFIQSLQTVINKASLSVEGIVQLSSSVSSTNETMASTPKAVKTAYEKAILGDLFGVCNATSTNINYNVTIDIPGVQTYYDGMEIKIVLNVECGELPTVNVNGWGNVRIKQGEDDIVAGDLKPYIPITLLKYGSYFFYKASNRLGNSDVVTDPNPKNPTWITSIACSGVPQIVRIKNYAQVYVVHDENLYLLDCKKKKETFLGSGYRNKARPITIDNTLKEWNGYWIYGTKLFNKTNNVFVRDFYDGVGHATTELYTYGYDSKGHSKQRTSDFYNDNYLILDAVNNKLYLIKALANLNNFYSNLYSYSSTGKGCEIAIPYRFEIYSVNSDLSLTYKSTIPESDTTWGNSNVGIGPEIISIKDDIIYMKCTTRADETPTLHYDDTGLDISLTTTVLPTISRFTKYSLSSGNEILALYGAPTAPHIAGRYTEYTSTDSTDSFNVSVINSPYGDRFINIMYDYRYNHDAKSSSDNKQIEKFEYKIYDMLLDKEIYSYQYKASDSGSNIHLPYPSNDYIVANSTNLCNNPLEFISYMGIHGYKKDTSVYYNEINTIYNYSVITSAYAIGINSSNTDKYFNIFNNKVLSKDEYYSLMYNTGHTTISIQIDIWIATNSERTILVYDSVTGSFKSEIHRFIGEIDNGVISYIDTYNYISNTSYIIDQDYTHYGLYPYYDIWKI